MEFSVNLTKKKSKWTDIKIEGIVSREILKFRANNLHFMIYRYIVEKRR